MGSLFLFAMRYFYEKPESWTITKARIYKCDHPLYSSCTLYKNGDLGLAVIQERFNPVLKATWWGPIDPWLVDDIFSRERFQQVFSDQAKPPENDIYPTIKVRSLMWLLRMKPMKIEYWEEKSF